jgi:hypothetical protein
MKVRLMLAVLFCLSLAAAPPATVPETTLRIEVKTLGDQPIDRASVIVKFVSGRNYIKLGKKIITEYELKTNQEGVTKVPSIPQGKILIQVIAKGYQTFGEKFDVNEAEKTIEIKLNPPQQPYSAHQ